MEFKFNNHWNLNGKHAIFGASKPSWLNYDEDKIVEAYYKSDAAERGTRLHAVAAELIELGIKQQKSKKTFCNYVNDAIGFRMQPEKVLYVNDNFFGTADAISYENGLLRIHDLKTGTGPVHPEQLKIYAAYFCLEYHLKPEEMQFELRIYQNDEVFLIEPDPCNKNWGAETLNEEVRNIMKIVISTDEVLKRIKEENK